MCIVPKIPAVLFGDYGSMVHTVLLLTIFIMLPATVINDYSIICVSHSEEIWELNRIEELINI